MNGEFYIAILDGEPVGIAKDEDEAIEIAINTNNGVGKPIYDDDMPDRIWLEHINVNRWVQCEKAPKCVEDKYTGNSILCSSTTEVHQALDMLNRADLERERAEAKVRALLM